MSRALAATEASAGPIARLRPRRSALVTAFARLTVALGLALAIALLLKSQWTNGFASVLSRTVTLALVGVAAFSFFERWPHRLPRGVARWVLQVVAVGVAMPVTTVLLYALTTREGAPPFWRDPDRVDGVMMLAFFSLLLAPWTALGALVRQREAWSREQALAFELERSELERAALAAKMQLLQARVAPHFLFNTLANVQALVDAGSPRAAGLLRSLTAYLRAAVPVLGDASVTLERELALTRAYLDLMHARMPDRLEVHVAADPAALGTLCPSTALLTLVENAVRHGIDPSEQGGRIEVAIERRGERALVRVSDSGVGLEDGDLAAGTGLATLRQRLRLMFGEAAALRVESRVPRGVIAEIELPAAAEGAP